MIQEWVFKSKEINNHWLKGEIQFYQFWESDIHCDPREDGKITQESITLWTEDLNTPDIATQPDTTGRLGFRTDKVTYVIYLVPGSTGLTWRYAPGETIRSQNKA